MGKYYYAGAGPFGLCQNQLCEHIYAAIVVKKSPLVLFWLLLLAATSSSAVSLGRHRGAALIGRPLDISVQAVFDAQEDPAGLCLDADVFYGDSKLGKSRVRVTTEKISSSAPESVIHIRSSVPVDEPVVTLYLRVGCQQKAEKRYVVLADMASEVAPGALPVITPQAARSAPVVNTPPASDSSISAASAAADRAAARAARRKRFGSSNSVSAAASGAAAVPLCLPSLLQKRPPQHHPGAVKKPRKTTVQVQKAVPG